MKNLIGHPMRSVVFRDELARCGIEAVPALTRDPELGIDAEGLADVGGGFVVRVARAPVYAVVQITPRLPYAAADAINDVPHVEDGGAYSTHDGRTLTIPQWSKVLGISAPTIYLRLAAGASDAEALAPRKRCRPTRTGRRARPPKTVRSARARGGRRNAVRRSPHEASVQ